MRMRLLFSRGVDRDRPHSGAAFHRYHFVLRTRLSKAVTIDIKHAAAAAGVLSGGDTEIALYVSFVNS